MFKHLVDWKFFSNDPIELIVKTNGKSDRMDRKCVLIIEDDKDIQETLAIVLMNEGIDVAQAYNGAEALRILEECCTLPCLILLDWAMPVMNGRTFLSALKATYPHYAEVIPVILISAIATQKEAEIFGAVKLFPKPFDVEELLDTVQAHCRQSIINTAELEESNEHLI